MCCCSAALTQCSSQLIEKWYSMVNLRYEGANSFSNLAMKLCVRLSAAPLHAWPPRQACMPSLPYKPANELGPVVLKVRLGL